MGQERKRTESAVNGAWRKKVTEVKINGRKGESSDSTKFC